jgi:chemotaxis protein CheD
MDEALLRHVNSGELRVGRGGEVLTALLGSCVAIGLIWREGGVCGLAHCLLPEPPRPVIGIGARFVSQAVPSLLLLMDIPPARRAEVDVVLAGGASMLGGAGLGAAVGRANVAAAQAALAAYGLPAPHQEVGGRRARRIRIDCDQRSFAVASFMREHQELSYAVD